MGAAGSWTVTVLTSSPGRYGHCREPVGHGAFWDWPGDTEVVIARKPS